MDKETLLFKVLGLIGSPQAMHLIETRLCELGLPAEGTLAELSIRELFHLANAVPSIRNGTSPTNAGANPSSRDAVLSTLPEGAALHLAMRRELADALIRHIAALGVRVTYADILLEGRNVDHFLAALGVLKNELQLAKAQSHGRALAVSAHFDRVHYKHHYRAPIAIRMETAPGSSSPTRPRLLIDVRQFGSTERFQASLRDALDRLAQDKSESDGEIVLEPFAGESKSVCWSFNAAFWHRLKDFEAATGISYDTSIGGSTDHNLAYVRSTARALHDRLHGHALDEGPLYVLEIGVAAVHRARALLDELKRLSELTGLNLYERIIYLLADFSQEILDRAKHDLQTHHPKIEGVIIDAAKPAVALAPYSGRIVHAHLCNVYDNLPTDKIALLDRAPYRVESRLYVKRNAVEALVARHKMKEGQRTELEQRLLTITHDREPGVLALLDWLATLCTERGDARLAYVAIWMDIVAILRLEERLVPLANQDELPATLALGLDDPIEQLIAQFGPLGDVQFHLSEEAIHGFRALLAVLHKAGALEVVDLFVQRAEEYLDRHKGPAKYDGSTVNWLNGPLFRAVAEANGCHVRFHSFKPFDPKSASVTMLAFPAP